MTSRARLALVGLSLAVACIALASPASAEETTRVVTVVGRFARPSVVIEVARAKAEIKLKDLQDPRVETTIRAAAKAPF